MTTIDQRGFAAALVLLGGSDHRGEFDAIATAGVDTQVAMAAASNVEPDKERGDVA